MAQKGKGKTRLETFRPSGEFVKGSFRRKTIEGHQVIFGRLRGAGKHQFALQAILHPEGDPPGCKFARTVAAARAFRDFSGQVERLSCPKPPRVAMKLGDIVSIVYRTDRGDGEADYEHKFKKPLPRLCTGPDGKGLFVAGGGFNVTERGVVG